MKVYIVYVWDYEANPENILGVFLTKQAAEKAWPRLLREYSYGNGTTSEVNIDILEREVKDA